MLTSAPLSRDPLPAIGFLGKDGPAYPPSRPSVASPTPVMSPSPNAMYSGQSLPYSPYAPPASSAPPPQSGYISPPESRRVLDDEKEKAASRQSLPSIHEALGKDNHLPYPAPTSAPQSTPGHPAPPTHLIGRAGEGPAGPPNPFSNGPPSGSLMREPAFPHQAPTEASRTSLTSINTSDSRNPSSLHSLSTGKSPTQSTKTGITSVSGSQNSSYDYSAPPSAGSVASPNGYSHSHYPPSYAYPPPSAPSYPPGPYDSRGYMGAPDVKGGFVGRPMPGQPHSDSVKRHLDVYDVETSLNEVWNRCGIFILLLFCFKTLLCLASSALGSRFRSSVDPRSTFCRDPRKQLADSCPNGNRLPR